MDHHHRDSHSSRPLPTHRTVGWATFSSPSAKGTHQPNSVRVARFARPAARATAFAGLLALLWIAALTLGGAAIAGDAEHARTEHAQIRKLIQMRNADVQRLPAAHAQARHRAVLPVGVNSKSCFDERHDVG